MRRCRRGLGKHFATSVLLLSLAACQSVTPPAEAPPESTALTEVALALSTNGNELVTVNGADSGVRVPIIGLNMDTTLLALDWRPSDSLVYALGSDGQLYTLTPEGTLTRVGTPQDYGNLSEGVAFDINPQLDAIRIIATATGRNFVTAPETGVPTEYTVSAYEGNEPANPKVLATAYSNPVSPFPENAVTTQYSLEAVGNTYAVQAKNDGTLTPIGKLTVDIEDFAGLDISAMTGYAYTILSDGDTQKLYRIGASAGTLTELAAEVGDLADLTIVP